MNWTKEKPSKAGYYWYSNCFTKDTEFKYNKIGIIYVDKLSNFYIEEPLNEFYIKEKDNLVAMNGGTDIIVLINTLNGMFSNEPIELPNNMKDNND